MNILKQYLSRAKEIIGDRSPDEILYDQKVLAWLRYGQSIKAAIEMANQASPGEALMVTDENIAYVEDYYDHLLNHTSIMDKLSKIS